MFITTRFPILYRRILYSLVLLSWCSGIAFFIFSRYVLIEGEFGPEKHPWQFPLLKVHGAAAFIMMLSLGAVITSHVPAGWRTGRHKIFGSILLGSIVFMVLSAWALYYLSSDANRELIGNIHAAVGVFLPFTVLWHVLQGIWSKRQRASGIRAA